MNGVIYSETIRPAAEAGDGETPTQIVATEENNGCAVWFCGYDHSELLQYIQRHTTAMSARTAAIRYAVFMADALRARRLIEKDAALFITARNLDATIRGKLAHD